jgi:hypothetical protein
MILVMQQKKIGSLSFRASLNAGLSYHLKQPTIWLGTKQKKRKQNGEKMKRKEIDMGEKREENNGAKSRRRGKKEKERKNEMLETRNMSYEYMSGTIRKISQGKIQ